MPSNRDELLKKNIEIPKRSTTPNGDLPRGTLDFATMHRTSGGPTHRMDFASGDGILQKQIRELKSRGLKGNFEIVKLPDDDFLLCHDFTFHNCMVDDETVTAAKAQEYLDKYFKILGSKEDFQKNPSLYDALAKNLEKNKDSCVAIYKRHGQLEHSSPIVGVYQKENGERSIKLIGKWGPEGPFGIHDIEDVMDDYLDQGITNWEIHFTEREKGRRMDL